MIKKFEFKDFMKRYKNIRSNKRRVKKDILHVLLNFKVVMLREIVMKKFLRILKSVIRLHLEDRIEGNEDIAKIESISLTYLEVMV